MAKDLTREVVRLANELKQIKKGQRYAHGGSIENTALEVRDDTGSLRAIVGVQGDGTTAVNIVNGPPPPAPSAPILGSVLGGITVSWDGQFAGGAIIPLDWQRVEVHASPTDGFTASLETLKTTFETPQGGTVVVPCDDPVYVRLIARNTSGTPSEPTAQAGPLGPAPVVATDLLDGIVTTVKLAEDAVTEAKIAAGAVTSNALADAAVLDTKLADNAVKVGKIAAGAVTLNTLGGALGDTASQRYADYFRDATAWEQLANVSGGSYVIDTTATDTPSGGGKLIATGSVQVAAKALIPQDTDTLYRVMIRVRVTAQDASPPLMFLGVAGVADDGVTLVNRAGANSNSMQAYCCSNGGSATTTDGWRTYVGWIQGHAAAGVTAPGGPNLDPRSPLITHADVRYLRPVIWLNYSRTTASVMECEAVTVEAIRTGVVGSTNLISGSVTAGAIAADAVTAGKIAADAVTAREIAAGTVTAAEIAAGTITAQEIAAGAITTPKVVAGAIQTLQLDTAAVNADKIASGAVTTAKLDALAVTADKIAANAITAEKIAAGAVDATAIAADAITGKTITGGTITGAQIQTAASGQRITLNEGDANEIIVYDGTGPIGELSPQGLLVKGTNGAVLWLDPNNIYPNLRLTNAAGDNSAIINVSSSDAKLGLNSGLFTGSGYTDMKWRHFMGGDFAVLERVRDSAPLSPIGGRVHLVSDYGAFGYVNSDDTTQNTVLAMYANLAQLSRGRLELFVTPSTASALYVGAQPGHTGNLLRLNNGGTDVMTVDKDGNTAIRGTLTAGNIATGTVTITPSNAHTPTSASVLFPTLTGTTFRGYATAATTVPGVRTPVGAQGVTGVSVSSVTSSNMLVWVNRENTTATVVNWMVIAS